MLRCVSILFKRPKDMDSAGVVGVRLNKKVFARNCAPSHRLCTHPLCYCAIRKVAEVAGRALKRNLMSLGPLILPYSEQLRYIRE